MNVYQPQRNKDLAKYSVQQCERLVLSYKKAQVIAVEACSASR